MLVQPQEGGGGHGFLTCSKWLCSEWHISRFQSAGQACPLISCHKSNYTMVRQDVNSISKGMTRASFPDNDNVLVPAYTSPCTISEFISVYNTQPHHLLNRSNGFFSAPMCYYTPFRAMHNMTPCLQFSCPVSPGPLWDPMVLLVHDTATRTHFL